MYKIILLCFFLLCGSLTAQADIRDLLKKSGRQIVIRIIDGDTVVLQDKSRVRLVGIQAPKLAIGKKGFRKKFKGWPLAMQSKKALSALILDKAVTLYYGGQRRDRYGRSLAHLFLDNGVWVQGAMLESGMARVYTFPDNRGAVTQMLRREQKARLNDTGIWALDFYRPIDQEKAAEYLNSFQIIKGRVRGAAKVRATYYLNFGDDWREDFTIMIKSAAARKFIKANLSPENYKGKEIEVRGWLKSYNGPMIEVTHPEQIRQIQ